ncbi:hypothetical protein TSOC_001278, partial [Tetrabaena socialis]
MGADTDGWLLELVRPVGERPPLAALAPHLLRLFHAADCFPRGGLFSGFYAVSAAMRYERYWLELMADGIAASAKPPLDVAFAWFVHRQDPADYQRSVMQVHAPAAGQSVHPQPGQAFSFGVFMPKAWGTVAGGHPLWPPPAPGSAFDATAPLVHGEQTAFAPRVAAAMSRFSWQLHTWLRPHFLDQAFLRRAQDRYDRFLALHADHPAATLVPTADIALMWHTHVALSSSYTATCRQLFGAQAEPWRPDYVDLDLQQTAAAYGETARLYAAKYGEPYDGTDTGWLPQGLPYPLASAASPIAFALRVFDDNPQQAKQQAHIDKLAAVLPQAFSGPVPRSGAHALYAAWLASGRAIPVFNDLTCGKCCFTSRKSVRKETLKHTVTSLVSLAYFLELPAWDTHDYMEGIAARSGLWPSGSSRACGPPAFLPSDVERYLLADERMVGLAATLAGAGGGKGLQALPFGGAAPLWVLLAQNAHVVEAKGHLDKAWAEAANHGVGAMRACNQPRGRRRSFDSGVYYYGPTYYTTSPLYYGDAALG